MALNPGEIIQDRYRIDSLLGQGGMGAVYHATDQRFGAPVALKENCMLSAEAQKQFAREAGLLYRLRHPNLPRVIDHFSLPGQGQYLVMDYVAGEDLGQVLKRHGPVPEAQALGWIEQVLDALEYLHSQQIVHRDVKPSNVKITPAGDVFLVDFGLAKVQDPDQQTTMGARGATPGYAPPEQYGQGRTDARSDVYSVGATLYALLTGRVPPDALEWVTGQAHLTPPREINPHISPGVEAAIRRAMQMRPADRFATAGEFLAALRGSSTRLAAVPASAPAARPAAQPGPMPRPRPPDGRHVPPPPEPRKAAQARGAAARRSDRPLFLGVAAICVLLVALVAWRLLLPGGPAAPTALPEQATTMPPGTTPLPGLLATRTPLPTPTGTHTPQPAAPATRTPTPAPASGRPAIAPDNVGSLAEVWLTKADSSQVYSLAFSPDGTTLASGSWYGTFLWSAADGSLLRQINGDRVDGLAFSPDGTLLATAGCATWSEEGVQDYYRACQEGLVKLQDPRDGRLILTLPPQPARVWAVAFSPDGQTLAVAYADNVARLWRVAGGAPVYELAHDNSVMAVAFSPDGRHLATGAWNGGLRLWTVATGAEEQNLKTEYIQGLAYSRDGQTLAAGTWEGDGRVVVWRLDKLDSQVLAGWPRAMDVALSPDATLLASGWSDCVVRLWRVAGGQLLRSLGEPQPGACEQLPVALSPDGTRLAWPQMGLLQLWGVP